MGPRSFNRGNFAERNRARRQLPGFNGAAVFQPRKSVVGAAARESIPGPLQWGRGLSTAEMASSNKLTIGPIQLQWGRGLSTAEI